MEKQTEEIPTVEEATGRVARAEKKYEQADKALDAAIEGERNAKLALNAARRALRIANRAQIDSQK